MRSQIIWADADCSIDNAALDLALEVFAERPADVSLLLFDGAALQHSAPPSTRLARRNNERGQREHCAQTSTPKGRFAAVARKTKH
jgi:hypothetical protein